MLRRVSFVAGLGMCLFAVTAVAADAELKSRSNVIGPEEIAALRARGPEGLAEAFRKYDALQAKAIQLQTESDRLSIAGFDENKAAVVETGRQVDDVRGRLENLRAAIDQIGGQRTCSVSRLYWYTDLDAAKAEAKRTGRPILSLRMLGKLTDEFSCANSRFFRTALYSNAKVSQFLRDNYVLHWQSVRPVPRVTIDFGDGRKLERTLTGNSAHYVLASDGTPLDVLPGLYSPLAFLQWAWDVRHFQLQFDKASSDEQTKMLQAFHAQKKDESLQRWDFDIQRLGDPRAELVSTRITSAMESAKLAGQEVPAEGPKPKAVAAARKAISKTAAEAPILRFANLGGTWMERGMDDDLWQAVADLHREDVKLDDASVAVMRQEFPAAVAARVAVSKARQEDPILRVVRTFENSISVDTVRNEYLLHRRIHEAFAENQAETANVDSLNEWVYATLFLTPSSDPWLGLAPPDVYTALEEDGRVEGQSEVAARDSG